MSIAAANLKRSINRFEMALAVVVVGLLVWLFSQRVQRTEAGMERASVELMVREIRTGIMILQTEKLAAGGYARLAAWAGRNPFALMGYSPHNYAGEISGDLPEQVEPGQWYFDRLGGQLVYRMARDEYLHTDLAGPRRIRYRLDVVFQDRDGDGRYEATRDTFQGLAFRPRDPYEWLDTAQ